LWNPFDDIVPRQKLIEEVKDIKPEKKPPPAAKKKLIPLVFW